MYNVHILYIWGVSEISGVPNMGILLFEGLIWWSSTFVKPKP